MRLRWKHPSIRLRLTLVYAVVLVVTCAALLALNYALLYNSLYTEINEPRTQTTPMAEPVSPTAASVIEDKLRADEIRKATAAQLRADTLLNTAGTSAIALAITRWWGSVSPGSSPAACSGRCERSPPPPAGDRHPPVLPCPPSSIALAQREPTNQATIGGGHRGVFQGHTDCHQRRPSVRRGARRGACGARVPPP
jgi:hypothetical protein